MASPPSSSAFPLNQRTLALTDAQIKALPSTALQVVPAAGANRLLVPVFACLTVDSNAGAYTNIAGAGSRLLALALGDPGGTIVMFLAISDGTLNEVDSLLAAGGFHLQTALHAGTYSTVLDTTSGDFGTNPDSEDNLPLFLYCENGAAGAYTGGNAAN